MKHGYFLTRMQWLLDLELLQLWACKGNNMRYQAPRVSALQSGYKIEQKQYSIVMLTVKSAFMMSRFGISRGASYILAPGWPDYAYTFDASS